MIFLMMIEKIEAEQFLKKNISNLPWFCQG